MSDDSTRLWDFRPALRAIDAAQAKQPASPQIDSAASSPPSLTKSISTDSSKSLPGSNNFSFTLGNFQKIFGYLGTSCSQDANGLVAEVLDRYKSKLTEKKLAETEDIQPVEVTETGQLRSGRSSVKERGKLRSRSQDYVKETKTVTWIDQAGKLVPHQVDGSSEEPNETDLSQLSKGARKRQNRKLRKLAAEQGLGTKQADERMSNATALDLSVTLKITAPHSHLTSDADTDTDVKKAVRQSQARRSVIQNIVTPTKKPAKGTAKNGTPAVVNPHDLFLHQVSESYAIEPPQSRTGTPLQARSGQLHTPQLINLNETFQRKVELLKLLFDNFPHENISLVRTRLSVSADEQLGFDSSGIHVFVDMSNILIGFHDALKRNRGLSISTKIPRQKLAFYNLSLILERGRPVAKRCLAGSKIVESVEEAAALGYEISTLDLVLKAKKMTPRKQYFAERDRRARAAERSEASSGGEGYLSGLGSGVEDGYEPAKYQEQGVDEILHLKMMESVVDSEPGVMVLATGDAAEAEYSQGFLKMCERALTKGWQIELVSFKRNMSGEYRRRDWMDRWGGAFRIVELDEYAEMLRL